MEIKLRGLSTKRLAIGALFLFLVAGVFLATSSDGPQASLERLFDPNTAADSLPDQVRSIFKLERISEDASQFLGTTVDGTLYWVSRTKDGQRICLVAHMPSGIGGVSCADKRDFLRDGLRMELEEGLGAVGEGEVPKIQSAFLRPDDAAFTHIPLDATLISPTLLTHTALNTLAGDMEDRLASAVPDGSGVVSFQAAESIPSPLADVGIRR